MAGWPVRKNDAAGFDVVFPIYDNDGDLVTAAASLDSEVSKDKGTFTDCTNEATEIATSSGMYYLTLTQAEINADVVATITKTSTSNAKTAANVVYTSTRNIDDLAYPTTSGRSIDVEATGEVGINLDNVVGTLDAAEIGADAITAAKIAAGAIDAATFAAGAIDATAIANAAIDAATFAAGAIDASAIATGAIDADAIAANAIGASEIADGAIDAGAIAAGAITSAKFAAGAIDASAIANAAIDAATFAAGAINAAAIANAAIDAATFAAGAIDANALAADAVDEIWDEAMSGHTTAGTFGEAMNDLYAGLVSITGAVSDAGPTATDFDTGLTEASDDHYNGHWLIFTSGNLIGQARMIRDYDGTAKNCAFDRAFTEAPANTDNFTILGAPSSAWDTLLARLADVEGETAVSNRMALWAIAKLVNKVDASTSTVTVYETDDTTSMWTQTATTDSGADPITVLDTA